MPGQEGLQRTGRIIDAVARAVDVPVTVKMRTGPKPGDRNAVSLARQAEQAGAVMITVHGRTRACGFTGSAEYDTIAAVKAAVQVPVVANGDIDQAERAQEVLCATGADAVMIGRGGLGRPWIFSQIDHFLETGEISPPPSLRQRLALLRDHLLDHYIFHGELRGVRTARKHVSWYLQEQPRAELFLQDFYRIETAQEQLDALDVWLEQRGEP